MTPRSKKLYSVWLDDHHRAGLKTIKERDGVPESEQVRRALDAWLQSKGVKKKPAKK